MIPISRTIVRALYRSGLRGRTRITLFLANRLKSLQAIPVRLASGAILYADLRLLSSHGLFLGWIQSAEESNLIQKVVMSDDIAWDIGAHIGLYTVVLSEAVRPNGKVCAFEPNPEAQEVLNLTVKLLDNVTLYPFGLSNKTEQAYLYIPGEPSAASFADWTNNEWGTTHKISCEIHRLDDLVENRRVPRPDFIKCDVEGAEELVFKGGRRTLDSKNAPIIFFEANDAAARGFSLTESGAMEFLANLSKPRFSFYALSGEEGLAPIKAVPRRTSGALAVNILAVPYSKANRLLGLNGFRTSMTS